MSKPVGKRMIITRCQFYLCEVSTKIEWKHFHRIRKCELYDTFNKDSAYNPNHPSFFKPYAKHYVFYKEQQIIGTVSTDKLDDLRAILRYVAIDNGYKNLGFGSIMLKQIEEFLKCHSFEIILLHATPWAYNFYKKNGFKKMKFVDEGQSINQDWIDMGKIIS
jgi:ribosomal protein S18 acetylase RimI-like enzyme